MTIRPTPTTPGWITVEQYRARRWYAIGAAYAPFPAAYRGASQDGLECRMAYNAGVIARLFGVSLHVVTE